MSGYHTKGRPRPHLWITGPDPKLHEMYHPWQMAKAQAKFRGEDFSLTFDQYKDLWINDWGNRGRQPENVCMTRIDPDGAWEWGNCEIITREQHFKRQAHMSAQTRNMSKYSKRIKK